MRACLNVVNHPSIVLSNRFRFTLADGQVCRRCSTVFRCIDAEALDGPDVRIVCRGCGLEFVTYERVRS
jgi:hypothetical protein